MRKPKLFQSAPQRKGNQNAFRGGAYSIVVTAVVLAILVGFEVPAGWFARMAAPFRGR